MTAMIRLFTLDRVWTDLTDEEFWWEPAEGSWGVRLRSDCRTPDPIGVGDWVMDFDRTVAASPVTSNSHPLTTIGWNLAHMGDPGTLVELDFLGGPRPAGGESSPLRVPSSAAEATDRLHAGWRRLVTALRNVDAGDLERSWQWEFGETNGWTYLAIVLNELSHHGAQICELRDLFRYRQVLLP